MRRIYIIFLTIILLFTTLLPIPVCAENTSSENETTASAPLLLQTPSAILMEAQSGTILYEKDCHKKLRPASITKIMTLLLIFEAIEDGLSKDEMVTVSEHAASMGGSQVYLEPNEQQSVNDLLKCICISSANDACVAMAENICGSEAAFVTLMNEKAKELGMNDTHFVNCCGLEAEGHLSSAYDIALMSRELITAHPDVFNYCGIWMDSITHHTRRGDSEFGLSNTNKLLKYYPYTTGLKTGYTSLAKYCLSATAKKDDIDLIAVVMADDSIQSRNKDATALFNYGFSKCQKYTDTTPPPLLPLSVRHGTTRELPIRYEQEFSYVITDGSNANDIQKELLLPEEIAAPVKKNDIVGLLRYKKGDSTIGEINILADEDIEAERFWQCYLRMLCKLLLS